MPASRRLVADYELVQRAMKNQPAASLELARRLDCVNKIMSARNILVGRRLSAHELDDVVQDVQLSLWQKLGHYRGQCKLESWVYGFCLLEYRRALREHRRRRERMTPIGQDVEDLVASPFVTDRLDGLERLPEGERRVILEKIVFSRSFSEIAGRRQESLGTVKSRYYRGIDRLRHLHSDWRNR